MAITMKVITYIPMPILFLIDMFRFLAGGYVIKFWYYIWVASQNK